MKIIFGVSNLKMLDGMIYIDIQSSVMPKNKLSIWSLCYLVV